MRLILRWSPIARERYLDILAYIQDNWGKDRAIKFIDITDDVLDKIVDFPRLYPSSSEQENVRRAVINKQVSVIYEIHEDYIDLLTFKDNRQQD